MTFNGLTSSVLDANLGSTNCTVEGFLAAQDSSGFTEVLVLGEGLSGGVWQFDTLQGRPQHPYRCTLACFCLVPRYLALQGSSQPEQLSVVAAEHESNYRLRLRSKVNAEDRPTCCSSLIYRFTRRSKWRFAPTSINVTKPSNAAQTGNAGTSTSAVAGSNVKLAPLDDVSPITSTASTK